MIVTLICLAVSTLLNLGYFMSTAMSLYVHEGDTVRRKPDHLVRFSLAGFLILNLALGLCAGPIYQMFLSGFSVFG